MLENIKRADDFELLDIHLNGDDDDVQESEIQHKNLKKAISEISGKHRQSEIRKEISNNVQSIDKVSLRDLIPINNKNTDLREVKSILSKEVVLEKPMHKAEHEKIRRQIGYDEAIKVTSEWEPVVMENRKSVQMKFPLMQSNVVSITKPKELGKAQKPNTKLEQEVAKILAGSDRGSLTRHEEKALLPHFKNFSEKEVKEAQEMRAEYMKQKALESYHAAKMKRQNKIKSKKFRRIQKKARQKQEGQNLEVLKDKNPEAYQEWLFKQEKKRIEERMTLKHKGTSKQMKKQMSYGKFNSESRQAVNEMLEKAKELTHKYDINSSDEEDEDKADDYVSSESEHESPEENMSRKRSLEDEFKTSRSKKSKKQKTEAPDVLTSMPFEVVGDIEMSVDDKDILAEFKEEKATIEERDKVNDVNTFIDGWGSWSGKGIKVPKKKLKRFIIKAPDAPPRKDNKMGHVIISELKDESVAKHQIDELPWKFNNVQEFQKSVNKPIGKQWNKEDKYRQKIKPKVVVKLGSIIEPIDKAVALKNYGTLAKNKLIN